MDFWQTVGGLFTGDTYFPDNVNRQARVTQLAGDCQQYSAQLSLDAEQIKTKLATFNTALAQALGGAAALPPDARLDNLDFASDKWTVDAAQLIVPLLTYPAVSAALTTAATSYLVASGEIGAAALVSLVGLPVAFEAIIGVAAGVFAIGAVFGVGAISGALQRSKLQDAIHEAVPARLKLYKAELVNHQVLQQLDALTAVVSAMSAADKSQADIIANLKTLVEGARADIDRTTDATAAASLAAYDKARNAWTNEDA